jgi:hypothetical protein
MHRRRKYKASGINMRPATANHVVVDGPPKKRSCAELILGVKQRFLLQSSQYLKEL